MDNEEDNGTTTRIMDTKKDNTQGQKITMRTTTMDNKEDDGLQLQDNTLQQGGWMTTTRMTRTTEDVSVHLVRRMDR